MTQCDRVAQRVKESTFLKKHGVVVHLPSREENPPGGIKENGWLSGFFDAKGYFFVNRTTLQGSITLSQKTPEVLEEIRASMGGCLFKDSNWGGYLYAASSAEDCERWFSYFKHFPLRCKKKGAKLVQFKRYRLFLSRGYHRLKEDDRKNARFRRLLKEIHQKEELEENLKPPYPFSIPSSFQITPLTFFGRHFPFISEK
jgi:hypothetical protein